MEWGFGYGESEYEVRVDLAPRNGELPPSEPKTPELFTWCLWHIHPEIKGQWLNWNFFFLKMANGEIGIIFFDLSFPVLALNVVTHFLISNYSILCND